MPFSPSNALILVSAFSLSLPSLAFADTVVLTPEVLQFIPLCAQPCFERFIAYEFSSTSSHFTGLSLNWLCTQTTSTSGDLVGVGAGDCVQAAINQGYCNRNSGDDPVSHLDVDIARNMCSRGTVLKGPVSSYSYSRQLRVEKWLTFAWSQRLVQWKRKVGVGIWPIWAFHFYSQQLRVGRSLSVWLALVSSWQRFAPVMRGRGNATWREALHHFLPG